MCLSKRDVLAADERDAVLAHLERAAADRVVTSVSCADADAPSLATLWATLDGAGDVVVGRGKRWHRDIDYARYAAAEAALGWLNADYAGTSDVALTSGEVPKRVVDAVADEVRRTSAVVGHVKARCTSANGVARAHAASTWAPTIVVEEHAAAPSTTSTTHAVRVNARATLAPHAMVALVERALRDIGTFHSTSDIAAFTPSAPKPTERIAGP